jgi:hypothetical protein
MDVETSGYLVLVSANDILRRKRDRLPSAPGALMLLDPGASVPQWSVKHGSEDAPWHS